MKLKEALSLLALDGVDTETITKKEVMKAFRDKSRVLHPDKYKPGTPDRSALRLECGWPARSMRRRERRDRSFFYELG